MATSDSRRTKVKRKDKDTVTEKVEDKASDKEQKSKSWLSNLAIFGDSSSALVTSFFLLVISIYAALWMDDGTQSIPPDAYSKLGPVPAIDPPRIFEIKADDPPIVSSEMRAAFEKDGVIAVRGLLSADILSRLDVASNDLIMEQKAKNKNKEKPRGAFTGQKKQTQFFSVKQGAIFRDPPIIGSEYNQTQSISPFVEVSLLSRIPQIAADLLHLADDQNETMRMLRDIFLAKDEEEYICGWHVDDTGFWPATAEAPGVNAWIALDDMPTDLGGGFAVAVGSHSAPWREEAYYITGATQTFPKEGFRSAGDMFERRTGNGTCNVKNSAPHLHRRMEETQRIYDVKRGDIIFHTRWLFHRTVPFERDAVSERQAKSSEELLYRRYSVRYGPGSSEIPRGYGVEPSVLWDKSNGGRTADEVSHKDGPWYPRVWPSVDLEELRQVKYLVKEKIPVAERRIEVRKKEMRPHRKKLTRQH
jgi:hypothetical protein